MALCISTVSADGSHCALHDVAAAISQVTSSEESVRVRLSYERGLRTSAVGF